MSESVWDYPRPPRLEPTGRRLRIEFNGVLLLDTARAYRVLETSHPPAYYVPPEDVRMEYLTESPSSSYCEFKGLARYFDVTVDGRTAGHAAWAYPEPTRGFEAMAGYLSFYAGKMDACFVDDERVKPQEGDFYGGWITEDLRGPFKGGPGTLGW
ncbi:hypothetical protein ABI59_21655 [Acidobacteria bacterium Mor1]|nr:hypothetical protein ABI59_21655 [Acidobacteria bacterium Mor1]